jgi:hypothetical protein
MIPNNSFKMMTLTVFGQQYGNLHPPNQFVDSNSESHVTHTHQRVEGFRLARHFTTIWVPQTERP